MWKLRYPSLHLQCLAAGSKESIIIHFGCIYAARLSHVDLPLGSPGFLWTSYSCLINIAAEAPVGHYKGNCRQEAALPSISPSLSLSPPASSCLPLSTTDSPCPSLHPLVPTCLFLPLILLFPLIHWRFSSPRTSSVKRTQEESCYFKSGISFIIKIHSCASKARIY